jgi:CheY-like chemotaxis protein/anti-sigma regulatory factor (Ser/Thr protein kinase)
LRQPTQALRLFNHVLAPLLTTDEQQHVLRQIQGATDNITSLLNSLLDISRLDACVVDIHKHAFALDAVLAKVYQQCFSLAAEHQIILRYQRTRLWVYSDPIQLERIVQNLLTNAIKHSQNVQGKVVLGVRRKAGMASIWVLDNGVGIPLKEQQAIFAEFYQLNGDERRRSKGLGLGLAIVKRLTVLLSHPLQLLSRPQQGTCFQLLLPQAQAVPSPPASPQAPLLVVSGQVLITDDDADIAQALALLVRQCGGEPVIARQLAEIKRLVNPASLVFILADYQLQNNRDGVELVFEVRDWLARDIPALVLTGNTNPQVLKNLALYGLAVLTKPVDPQLLFAEMQKHILTQIN